MSLIDIPLITDYLFDCVMLDKTTVSDGYGGYTATWREGAEFSAAIACDTSMQARTAEKAGVTSLYTVTTSRVLTLQYHDVFKRVKDGKVFRVTSDGDDKFTPASAGLDMRQVSAEEFILSSEVVSNGAGNNSGNG